MKRKLESLRANLRLGTGVLILVIVAAVGLLAQSGVGLFAKLKIGPANNCTIQAGAGSPLGSVTGSVCDLYLRTDGGSGTTFWVKATGTASTSGWEQAGSGGGSAGLGGQQVLRKTADQSVTSSTVLVNDSHLAFNIAANENWTVRYTLFVDAGAAGDLKVGLSVPSGATYRIGRGALPNTAGTIDVAGTSTTTLSVGGQGAGTVYAYTFYGVVTNGSTAGSVTLQFAQDTSDATATTLKTNSVAVAEPVGGAGAAASAGSFILLATQTASASTSLDFASFITADYDTYAIRLTNVLPATSTANLLLRVSTDGGATYDSAANYQTNVLRWSKTASVAGGSATDTSIPLTTSPANTSTNGGISGLVYLVNPSNATQWKQFYGNVTYRESTTPEQLGGAISGAYASTTAVNAIRLVFSSGNITSGTVQIYGLANKVLTPPAGIATGTWASRSTATIDGRIFLPNDGYTLGRDTGSAWSTWGPLFPMTPPSTSGWSWVNQGGASLAATADSQSILDVATTSGTTIRARVKTVPATPYTITAHLLATTFGKDFLAHGLVWRDSATGKIVWFNVVGQSTGVFDVLVQKYTNETTLSATYQTTHLGYSAQWMRITDDGVNRKAFLSVDGQNWVQIHSIGHTDFITPDQVGFAVQSNNTTTPNFAVNATLLSWKEQ